MFTIEVKIACDDPPFYKWRAVRPVGGKPYTYETREEVEAQIRKWYRDRVMNDVRVGTE